MLLALLLTQAYAMCLRSEVDLQVDPALHTDGSLYARVVGGDRLTEGFVVRVAPGGHSNGHSTSRSVGALRR